MSKESDYKARMETLGVWADAFEGAVHDLCMLERDQAKTRTAWRKALAEGNADLTASLFKLLMEQDEAIKAYREALCLTPRAVRKLQSGFGERLPSAASADNVTPITPLQQIRRKRREA